MPYAEGRTYCDAASHTMETRSWLTPFADPGIRSRLRPFAPDLQRHRPAHLPLADAGGLDDAREPLTGPEARAQAEANLMLAKEWAALGASDPQARSTALDLLGFERQLIFSTFASTQFAGPTDPELFYGGAQAHNRAMVAFCADDKRMLPVGMIPMSIPSATPRSRLRPSGSVLAPFCCRRRPPPRSLRRTAPTTLSGLASATLTESSA